MRFFKNLITALNEFQQRVINAADKDTPLIVYAPSTRGKTFLFNHLYNNGWTRTLTERSALSTIYPQTLTVIYSRPSMRTRVASPSLSSARA